MDSGLLLNQFKRVKPHCAIRLPFHQPTAVPIDLKSIGPLYDRCKVSRQTKRIIGEEVFRQPHGSGIPVPLYGRISAPAVFIPLQADLLNQKCGQMLRLITVLSHRRTSYYNHLYQGISKRRSSYSFWQYTKPRMQKAGSVLTMGMQYVEQQMLEKQSLSGDFDLVASASGSVKKLLTFAAKLDKELDEPSSKKLYSYSEDYGYGLTGWLKVVVENGRIRSCRFDEIFADNEEDIVHPELKKYYRQSKYDCPTYEDPFPSGWDRHAFLVGFRTQMDNLNLKVCATQNMLDLTGLPHAAGRDMGMIWDNPNPDHAHLDMDPKNRPMYPAFINYLRMAKVVLEEMRKDGVFQ